MSGIKQLRINQLIDSGYVFACKNNNEHLILSLVGGIVDYWPSSGKFHDRTTGHRGDNSDEFHTLIRHRRDGLPIRVVGVSRPVEATVDPRDHRIAELESLLFQAYTLRTNWDDTLTGNVLRVLSKPEAHKNSSKMPWDS